MDDTDTGWHNVGDDIRMKSVNNGKIVVIAPRDLHQTVIPLFCPLCTFPMITREDGHSYRKTNCCERCDLRWGRSIRDHGEANDLLKETAEWKEYIADRLKRSRQLIKLK